ncbi:sugar nucleotide-binding protein, partial [Vibrio sp. 10N.222.54.B11]
GVYHYSGLPHVSWFEFAEAIFNVAVEQGVIASKPSLSTIATEQYLTPVKRPINSKLSTEKIMTLLAVEPSDWKAALSNIKAYAG